MDPELWELFEAGDSNDEVAAILRLGQPGIVPEGVQIVTGFGDIVTVRIQRGATQEIRENELVSSMKPRGAQFGPDVQLIESELSQERLSERPSATDQRRPSLLTATGRGVVVGAVDWGFDFAHPDFRQLDGKTRILALWDQRGPARPGSPRPYGYGIAHTREAIDRALASPDPYAALGYHPADSDTGQGAHGTHVLSIAAGNGGAGGPMGIAPEADLVLVHSANWGSAETSLGDSVTLLEAIDFILRLAGERPCVINLSMGRHCGQHDGSTLVEQGLDAALRAAPGRAICQSAGNYFERRVHAAGQLRPGLKHNLTWEITEADATPNQLEIWYSWRDEIEVEISSPDGSISARARLGERTVLKADGREIGKLYHRAREPNTLDNHIVIFLYKQAPQGPWKLSLIPIDIIDGRFHAWIERDAACPSCQSIFRKEDAVSSSTTGTICNGLRTIAVGAYDPHNSERPIAHFSSAGPTRDGRIKPDLCAPGVRILAARSAPRGLEDNPPLLTCMSGTSMAAPCATGTVALMFEVAPRRLRIEETHTLLLGSAEAFSSDGEQMERGGSGYLNITAAVEAARTVGATNVGSRPPLESKRMASESQLEMESDQAQEDQDKIEGPESSDEKHFLLISGGPGPFAKGDPEHDQSWANYVTPPLLLTDSGAKKKDFVRKDETVTWLIYRPAYETRWAADDSSTLAERKKEVKRIKGKSCNSGLCASYVDFLELRASESKWDLKWITKADDIWDHIRGLPKNSISRVYYWGHARKDLWFSLRHRTGEGSVPIAISPENHEILTVGSIDSKLRDRFGKSTVPDMHRFIGCNTARFAEEWADAFQVWAEGVEGKVDFASIHKSGGEPCLVADAEVKLFPAHGQEKERKKWQPKPEKCGGATGESFKEGSDELLELPAITERWDDFPVSDQNGNGDRLILPVERACAECEARREAINEPEVIEDLIPLVVRRADTTILAGNSDRFSSHLIGELLSGLGHSTFDHSRMTAGGLFNAFTRGPSLSHFDLIAAPGVLVRILPRPGDIICRRGEGGLAHASIIASRDVWRREHLRAAGLTAEGPRLGIYVQVIESGWQPHSSSDQFARLLTDAEGCLPFDQLLVRPRRVSDNMPGSFIEQVIPAKQDSDSCRKRWLQEVAQYPIEVRNAVANAPANGWYDIVTWARAKGIDDESTLRRLIYFAFWGPTNGYCEPKAQAAKKDWDIALTSVRIFVRSRPWPPLAEARAEPCSKRKRKEVPDNPALDITGRYVGNDGKTYAFNQAGLHFECVRSWPLDPDDELRYPNRKNRPLAELLGDLRDQVYYFFNRGEPGEYGTIQQRNGGFVITYQNKDPETEYALKSVEQRATVFLRDVHGGRLSFQEAYELAPLTPDQKRDIEEIMDKAAIEKLLDAYNNKGVKKAFDILLSRLVNLTPCHLESADQKLARQRIGEKCKPKLDRFHKVDLPLVRVHVQQVLTNNKWTSDRNITLSHIQWMQRMFAKEGASTAGTDLAKLLEDYAGIRPIKDPDKEPENEYEFTLHLTGASLLIGGYTGSLEVEQTAGQRKWGKKAYDIELGGGTVALTLFDVKIGAEYKGAAKTDLAWTENDIPGSVRFAIGSASVGMEIAGVQLGFMHVFGDETLPLMEVIFQEAKLGVPNINKIVEEMAKTRKLPHTKGVVGFDVSASVLFGSITPAGSVMDKITHASHYDPVDLSLNYKSDLAVERNLWSQLHFCLDDDSLTESGRQALRMMCARYLPELMSKGGYLGVLGHADTLGSSDYNFDLSKRRAESTVEAIRKIMGEKFKISKDHITTLGLGEIIAAFKSKGKTVPSPEDRRVQVFINANLVLTLFGTPGVSALHETEAGEFARTDESYLRWVQESLNSILGTELLLDGLFNHATRGAIRQFQRQEGLQVDGNVGPMTERALLQSGAVPPPSPITEDLPGSALPLPCPGSTNETISRFPRYSNSAEALPVEERDKIRVLAQFIVGSFQAGCTPIGTVRLIGHADRDPERESREPGFEVNVSLRRAEAIEKALKDLIHDPGISSHIVWDHRGAGSTDLAVPNAATELERQRNRRVEVLLMPASSPPPPPPPSPPSVITCPTPLTPPVGAPGAPADVSTLIRIVGVVLHGVPLGMVGASVPSAARFLDSREQSEAITMYGSSLDFTKIVVTDGIGFSGRPFTVAVPLPSGFHVAMNLGDLCSWASPPRSHTLIHELAHAWQSQHHGSDPTAFMRNSVECQVRAIADIPLAKGAAASSATAAAVAHGVFDPRKLASIAAAAAAAEDVSAYAYIPHKPFAEYAAEQIAEQVEHSYRHACCPTPAIAAAVRSFGLHVRSPDNETSLTVISFHRKSTPGVVFV